MKTLLILAALCPIAASAGQKDVLRSYDQVLECQGAEQSGAAVSFKLVMENYDGRTYGKREIKKFKLAGEKQPKLDLLKDHYKCANGEKSPVAFRQNGEKFHLSLTCQGGLTIKGACQKVEASSDEGFYEENVAEDVVGD